MYHMVFPIKYRRSVISEEVGESLKQICIELSERYAIHFVEIGYEGDHVHFLIQSVPKMSVSKIVGSVKSIRAKEIFRRHPMVKGRLWGGNFWTSGFYAKTVGQYGNQEMIQRYIENQGNNGPYIELHKDQLWLFDRYLVVSAPR
ncbi:MAG: IS200/IS605 family transposase [Balneolaceae bacterium]|nr:IS200/IS605 family transposase [Balneolaceae bacterium]